MQTRIATELARRPECFIVHPREVGILNTLTVSEQEDFAQRNGWRMVRRLGGRQLHFYNDPFGQPAAL